VFACRYIQNFPGSSLDKEMKASELVSLSGAGVRVVANWEWSANPPNDRATGKDHATKAKARLASLHVPDWAPVYYSIDTGLQAGARNAYAQGWRDVYPADQLGVYTCGALFRQLKADGYVKYAWQSMSRSFPGNHLAGQPDIWDHRGADIIQTGNGSLLGKALDWDTATVDDYGGFLMGEDNPTMALTDADVTKIVTALTNDEDFQALIWRVNALIDNTPVAQGPTKGEVNKLAAAVSKIPTTAVPSQPVDLDALAAKVADLLAARLQN